MVVHLDLRPDPPVARRHLSQVCHKFLTENGKELYIIEKWHVAFALYSQQNAPLNFHIQQYALENGVVCQNKFQSKTSSDV